MEHAGTCVRLGGVGGGHAICGQSVNSDLGPGRERSGPRFCSGPQIECSSAAASVAYRRAARRRRRTVRTTRPMTSNTQAAKAMLCIVKTDGASSGAARHLLPLQRPLVTPSQPLPLYLFGLNLDIG